MYVRGLATRDAERMFVEDLGQQMLSRSGVGRITLPTESSGLRLLYASLITASKSWHGVKTTPDIW
jgi:transposase-like protein